MATDRPYVVMDVGSGMSKLGFAGNLQPTFTVPTVLASRQAEQQPLRGGTGTCDQDCIGEDAINNMNYHAGVNLVSPMRQSIVEDWDAMERFYAASLFQYLRVEPEDHCVLCTEGAAASREARQQLAEIMFETFGVAGLYLGVQAVLSLYTAAGVAAGAAASGSADWRAALTAASAQGVDPYGLTGVVVDVGEGSTTVVPVMDGFVARSGIRSVGVGGRDLTSAVQQALRAAHPSLPPQLSWETARRVKEAHCYVCADPATEPARLAVRHAAGKSQPKMWSLRDPRAGGRELSLQLGHELFMAPELLFSRPPTAPGGGPSPSAATLPSNRNTQGGWQPLPQVVDGVIQGCPIDVRRPLYGSVALAGGTACVRNFGRRMQVELSRLANGRLPEGSKTLDIRVLEGGWAPNAAWLGGSLLTGGAAPQALVEASTTTRAHWQEHGALMGAGLLDGA